MLKGLFVGILNVDMFTCKMYFDKAYQVVPLRRKQKIDQLKNEKDKIRSLAAELLLNYCLLEYGQIQNDLEAEDDAEIKNIIVKTVLASDIGESILHDKAFLYEIEYQCRGKPILIGVNDVHFNLSHAGDYVVCAVANVPVGIDIEGKHKINEKVMKKCFSEIESNWVYENQTLPHFARQLIDLEKKQERFFRLWTAKEAVSKATGKGLSQIIEGIYFKVGDNFVLDNNNLKDNCLKDKYHLYEIDNLKEKGYCITVAVEN